MVLLSTDVTATVLSLNNVDVTKTFESNICPLIPSL